MAGIELGTCETVVSILNMTSQKTPSVVECVATGDKPDYGKSTCSQNIVSLQPSWKLCPDNIII